MAAGLKVGVLMMMVTMMMSNRGVSSEAPTVYEILPKYGLPSGLLPTNVKSYRLSEEDGEFEVELLDTCYIKFEYMVYYEKVITGVLRYGSITHLKGIQVQKLFLWFDVDEIKVDLPPSSSIYFQVGIITKKLSVDQFLTVHSCSKNNNAFHFQLPPAVDDEIPMLLTE
ncbi:hypothetical protein RND81_04G247100 [Saponaria officinalis]|uniref:Uncharacterized protein n=1 Tax=Saponaria officinalis TaxID=3572 RepID=A0AAW1LQI2_SAPOF